MIINFLSYFTASFSKYEHFTVNIQNYALHVSVGSYLMFSLFLIKYLFLIRLLSKVAGKGNTVEISVFYSGRHDTVINTPA